MSFSFIFSVKREKKIKGKSITPEALKMESIKQTSLGYDNATYHSVQDLSP